MEDKHRPDTRRGHDRGFCSRRRRHRGNCFIRPTLTFSKSTARDTFGGFPLQLKTFKNRLKKMLLTLSFIGQDQVSTGESPDTHLSHSEK